MSSRRARGSSILRSSFVALLLLTLPLGVGAQPAGRVYRIGILENRSIQLNAANIDALRDGLRQLGYNEGQNVEITHRSADGHDERLPALASELVR